MPRNTVSTSFRRFAEASFSDEVDLVFLTLSHPDITDINVVWDTVNFIYNSITWIGFPFDITIMTDDEQPPKATLTIQNVDSQIGETIRTLFTPPRLKIEILSSTDFNLTVNPRTPIGTPTAVYTADRLFLTNVRVDPIAVQGDIEGWNYLQRVWPGKRARQDLLPGLFR